MHIVLNAALWLKARTIGTNQPPIATMERSLLLELYWKTALRMALVFGAMPVVIEMTETAEGLERLAITQALQAGYVKPGQPVVITAGLPFNVSGTTNLIKVATAEWS